MSGLNHYSEKQRKEIRRKNHVAKDLASTKYRNRIRESNRRTLIDQIHREEIDEEYQFFKEVGLVVKE